VTTVEIFQLNGVPVPPEVYERVDADPWHGVMSTARIRRELGYRPMFPSVHTARDAGVL
jgi:hypothetical protein